MGETVLKQLTNETNRMLDQVIRDLRRLPYDAEIEYLESTGTQYVDTEVVPTYTLDTRSEWSGSWTQDIPLFGSRGANKFAPFGIWLYATKQGRFDFYNGDLLSPSAISPLSPIYVNTQRNLAQINNQTITAPETSSAFSGKNIWLFAYNNNGVVGGNPVSMRLTFWKAFKNNVLVRDFIPVRLGTTGYLYDKVSGQLFGNAGTGEFVLGPDKKTTRDYVQDGLVAMWDGIENTRERESIIQMPLLG